MDKKDLIKYIDRINLTGPGGRDKIKKILMDFAVNGAGGGGGGGGGGDDDPILSKYVYYGGSNTSIPVDGNTGNVIGMFDRSKYGIIRDVPCYSKYYYIAIPLSFHLEKVVTENAEDIVDLFIAKGAYLQNGESYVLNEFHLSSDIPLNVNITITVTE